MYFKATYWFFAALISCSGALAQPVVQQAGFAPSGGDHTQEAISALPNPAFFVRQAHTDAVYEQQLQLEGGKEEMDFWTDQRAFERELYRQNLAAYKVYIKAKRDVYSTHQQSCGPACMHGDYYYLQASFYLQMGSDSNGDSWMFGSLDSGGGLIAAGPE